MFFSAQSRGRGRGRGRVLASLFASSLVVLAIPGSPAADPTDSGTAGAPVVVWIDLPDGCEEDHFRTAWVSLRDIGVALARDTFEASPSVVEAIEILLVHRARAVVWHDPLGGLQVLFQGAGAPERISAPSGDPGEEGLYLAELMRSRVGDGGGFDNLLVTAPGEVIAEEPGAGAAGVALEGGSGTQSEVSLEGARFGAGYAARAHRDDVTWWQHAIQFLLPAWRIDDLWMIRGTVRMGLPASVGRKGTEWLQMRGFGVDLGAGFFPARGRHLELELGIAAGIENQIAVAFLSTGDSERGEHLSATASATAAVLWHPGRRTEVRAFFSTAYVFSPPSFSIRGEGDFGSRPWQPTLGVDITVLLYGE